MIMIQCPKAEHAMLQEGEVSKSHRRHEESNPRLGAQGEQPSPCIAPVRGLKRYTGRETCAKAYKMMQLPTSDRCFRYKSRKRCTKGGDEKRPLHNQPIENDLLALLLCLNPTHTLCSNCSKEAASCVHPIYMTNSQTLTILQFPKFLTNPTFCTRQQCI